ncbi:MAG: Methyltransf 11 protein [Bacteroidetes bacterium]|nr:Methyltransf 11 protein [Bacteroidota bacterium]
MIESQKYDNLIAQEARHWGEVRQDPQNPQIWHDPQLFEIFFGKEYRHMVESAVTRGPRILELGCGEGSLTLELASRGMKVTGIDLSPQRIERARLKAEDIRLQVPPTFIIGDLNTIKLPSGPFDCVVAHDSLHHILALDRLCDEAKNSLRPGGHFLVIDYIGMGFWRKLLAGFLYAILPTYQPYTMKWGLRNRLASFLATERKKRKALEEASSGALHHDSPFEEISQTSIIHELEHRFDILEQRTFCPFWFYLVAKVRMPERMRYPMARLLRSFDDLISSFRLSRGAYVWIAAHKPPTAG